MPSDRRDQTRQGSSGGEETASARTVIGRDGRVLLFSCDQFISDICLGDCCFVCGARPGTKPFNDEHVLPKWLLRRFSLFDKKLTLYDGQDRDYGGYVMPCCADCNAMLGREIEAPVSKLLGGDFEATVGRLNPQTMELLFRWLCLVFLKTHMKDRLVASRHDPRKDRGSLADNYAWPQMHHLHCVARSPFVKAKIEPEVIGSMLIFEIVDEAVDDTFDYADLTNEQTILMRLGNLGLVAVLNDCCAATLAWTHGLSLIRGPLSTTQLREVAARLGVANADLVNRPVFGTAIDLATSSVRLWAQHERTPLFAPFDPKAFGAALAFLLQGRLMGLGLGGVRDPDQVDALIREGRASFLFDGQGAFTPAVVRFEAD